MNEKQFESAVVDLAHMFGWEVASFDRAMNRRGDFRTPVKYDGKGYPDLTMVHPAWGVIFAEMKVGYHKPTEEQVAWGETLSQACGLDPAGHFRYRLWYPKDSAGIGFELSGGRVTDWSI